jgi:hypothetical protein
MIDSSNYVEHVLRTDSSVTSELLERLQNRETVRLLHAAMGMSTEAAELIDILKKHIFYGMPIDSVNAAEEIGDNQWYVGLAISVLRSTMNEILTMNIEKLRIRYPDKFSEADAVTRDIPSERKLLERSKRGSDWNEFSRNVSAHIEDYTVPQYGDKGEDQATDYSIYDHLKQVLKYISRFGKNSRPGQEYLDFLKAAHYIQMAATLYQNKKCSKNTISVSSSSDLIDPDASGEADSSEKLGLTEN